MAQIEILLEKQLLTIQNREIIASGDSNFDSCVFTFDDTWEKFVKTAVFYQNKNNVQYVVLNSDDTCMIPAAAMADEGRMYVGVFGIKDTSVVTSTLDTIDIKQGAISGSNVSTEPTDDVFLAIIAQYQRIVELMAQYENAAAEFNVRIAEQNAILETLNAFDVTAISERLDIIENRMIDYTNLAKEIQNREIILREVPIKFVNKMCTIENEAFTEDSLCDVYFDACSYEIASKALILPVSHEGYMELSSSVDLLDELKANILIRRS